MADRPITAASGPIGVAESGHAGCLPPGYQLREFEIERVLGEGGFGVVYSAIDLKLERRVAIKEYMPAAFATREADYSIRVRASPQTQEAFIAGLRSFVNEAKLLASFEHPALIKVYQFWEEKGTAYMVMPFYAEPTLKAWIKQHGPAPEEAWLKRLLVGVSEALEALHGEQCLHRDVAPDNILLLDDGSPLLLDFGAARLVLGDLTQALTVILKPGYAPVEQYAATAAMKQGPWTDVYALCGVGYYAITGNAPAPAIARVVADELQPLSKVAAGRYSARLLAALDAGLAIRPEQRPQSMNALRRLMLEDAEYDHERTVVSARSRRAALGTTGGRPRTVGSDGNRSGSAGQVSERPRGAVSEPARPLPQSADDRTVVAGPDDDRTVVAGAGTRSPTRVDDDRTVVAGADDDRTVAATKHPPLRTAPRTAGPVSLPSTPHPRPHAAEQGRGEPRARRGLAAFALSAAAVGVAGVAAVLLWPAAPPPATVSERGGTTDPTVTSVKAGVAAAPGALSGPSAPVPPSPAAASGAQGESAAPSKRAEPASSIAAATAPAAASPPVAAAPGAASSQPATPVPGAATSSPSADVSPGAATSGSASPGPALVQEKPSQSAPAAPVPKESRPTTTTAPAKPQPAKQIAAAPGTTTKPAAKPASAAPDRTPAPRPQTTPAAPAQAQAETLAAAPPGVANELVAPAAPASGIDPKRIEREVNYELLTKNVRGVAARVNADLVVTLFGSTTAGERSRAIGIARGVPGVKGVDDQVFVMK